LTAFSFARIRFLFRHAPQREPPAPVLRADVREAQERERLGLAEPPLLSPLGGEPAELDQARLPGRQLQVELREPVAQLGEEPLGVVAVLEPHHEVIGETDDHDLAARPLAPPSIGPPVEHVVQVHVGEQR
jgi:hypothetical protein